MSENRKKNDIINPNIRQRSLIMFKIVNGGTIKREYTWTGIIFGSPKSGKSTLGASFDKPILIDLDHGAHRIAGKDRTGLDIVQCDKWEDFQAIAAAPELKEYKTIVVDTFGAAVDMIIRDKFSNTMNPAKWGAVKNEIMSICNQLKMTGRSVLFLAHESEEKSDDKIIKRPQCQGKAKDELMKILDFIGHTTKAGNDYVLEFGGDDSIYVGNTFGFKNRYVLPDVKTEPNTFGKDVIEKQIADFLAADEQANAALVEQMTKLRDQIEKCKTDKDFTAMITTIADAKNLTNGAALKLKKELVDKATESGLIYDRAIAGFKPQEQTEAQ